MAQVVPMLFTQDVNRLRDFYESLGFVQTNQWLDQGELAWMELAFLEMTIILQRTKRSTDTGGNTDVELYFVCENVDAIRQTWHRRGLELPEPSTAFYGMRQLFLKDPDGRTVCFESQSKD